MVVRESMRERAHFLRDKEWPYAHPVCGIVNNVNTQEPRWLILENEHKISDATYIVNLCFLF